MNHLKLFQERNYISIINALLMKTVKNGASKEEAKSAATKAKEMMDRHSISRSQVQMNPEMAHYIYGEPMPKEEPKEKKTQQKKSDSWYEKQGFKKAQVINIDGKDYDVGDLAKKLWDTGNSWWEKDECEEYARKFLVQLRSTHMWEGPVYCIFGINDDEAIKFDGSTLLFLSADSDYMQEVLYDFAHDNYYEDLYFAEIKPSNSGIKKWINIDATINNFIDIPQEWSIIPKRDLKGLYNSANFKDLEKIKVSRRKY